MSLGQLLSRRMSTMGKRGIAVAAAIAAAQLWSPSTNATPPEPGWNSTYCTLSYQNVGGTDYCYWEPSWDGSLYGTGDLMSYYIGINSTTVYAGVLDSSGGQKNTVATDAGDNFIDYTSTGFPDTTYIYDGTTNYEFGLYAHHAGEGSSATLWVGAVRST